MKTAKKTKAMNWQTIRARMSLLEYFRLNSPPSIMPTTPVTRMPSVVSMKITSRMPENVLMPVIERGCPRSARLWAEHQCRLAWVGLIGEGFNFEAAQYDNKDGGPPRGGEFMLALDPARFGDREGWLSYTEAFFAALSGLKGARLPGDRRYAIRAKSPDTGLKIPDSLHEKILAICDADASGK